MRKKCSKCGQDKDLTKFGKWKFGKDGLRPTCRACKTEQDKHYKDYNREYSKRYYTYTARGRYFRLKNSAKKHGNSVNMTATEFVSWWNSQSKTCYYCGQGLTIGAGIKHRPSALTIDRRDNTMGYTLENIAFACRRCNLIKGDWLTEKQMLEIATKYFRAAS